MNGRLYKRILLAYDGTVKGRAALREGALLAQQLGAEVYLLSVVAQVPGTQLADGVGAGEVEPRQDDYKAVLKDGERRLREAGFEAVAKLVIGDPADEIGAYAKQIAADLVIVGHHRQSVLDRWWSGPSGAYLIDRISCSMLVSQNVISDEEFAAALAAGSIRGGAASAGVSKPGLSPVYDSPKPVDQVAPSRPSSRRRRLRAALFFALPVALIIGLIGYALGGRIMTTDNAYVDADKVGISTDIAGIVKEVDVTENQHVLAGQLLYKLDDLPFRIAAQRAAAQVGIARQSLEALQSSYRDTQAQLRQTQYDVDYYNTEFRRTQQLRQARVASQTAFDEARRNLQAAQQRLASARQQVAGVTANLGGDPEAPIERNPRYLDAVAQRDEAERQLAHTVVKAPFAGIVTNVPSIAPGRYLQVQATAFFLVATDHIWVDANPKETELTNVRSGQPATIRVDTYPGASWTGIVESISPAAAQEFSLLPAQNTSGNWVKVVQRIPIRIRVDTTRRDMPPLRAGMSVEVSIDTGHRRGIAGWFTRPAGGRS